MNVARDVAGIGFFLLVCVVSGAVIGMLLALMVSGAVPSL